MNDNIFSAYLRAEAYNKLVKPRKPKKVDWSPMIVPVSIAAPIMETNAADIKKPISGIRLHKVESEDNNDATG